MASSALVPALRTKNPAVVVTPDRGLHDGQTVQVQVTGFGVGGIVSLSECGTASAANSAGCGEQLAAQARLSTDDHGMGHAAYAVKAIAATKPYNLTALVSCRDNCVLVATVGISFGFATAPLAFAGP